MDTLKVLGQNNPTANSLIDVYVVPAATSATISSFIVCNQSGGFISFSVSVAINGATNDPKQYLYFNTPLDANDTFTATLGISLGPNDVIRFKTSDNNVSINIFGVEVN